MRRVVGSTDAEWQAFAESPTFPRRVAAAGTVVRELRAGIGDRADLHRFVGVRQPVLQVVGGASDGRFVAAARDLAAILTDCRTEVILGARHAAHHTHPDEFVAVVIGFTRP
jgi:pimeloyl-ACP methyl ester carboxylesterase